MMSSHGSQAGLDAFGYMRWTATSCRSCGYEPKDCTCPGGAIIMTDKEWVLDYLFNDPKRKLVNFDVMPGPNCRTEDDIYRALRSVFEQDQRGELVHSHTFKDVDTDPVDVDEWVKSLNKEP